MRTLLALAGLLFSFRVFAVSADDKEPLADLPRLAVERSQITLPGSRPFHLRATVVEATNLENDNYRAEIEEYWAAPDKWRRTVKTESFNERAISFYEANGFKRVGLSSEELEGKRVDLAVLRRRIASNRTGRD